MKIVLNIENMRCKKCVKHITDELNEISSINNFEVILKEKKVVIEIEDEDLLENILFTLDYAGYTATVVNE